MNDQEQSPKTDQGQSPKEEAAQLKDKSYKEVMDQLNTSKDGLSESEVEKRRERYGYNELVERKESPILTFLSYFWGPIPWMIEVAVVLSAVVKHWLDVGVIMALLVMNGIVGFWEEFQASNTIEALKNKLAPDARVRRDGEWKTIPGRELVPGDIVRLRMGQIVPADAKMTKGDPIQVDQSALTGESLPVDRKTDDAVYSGSVVKQGEANAVVYATGANTYFGKTAELVQEAETKSHFQRAVLKIGDYLIGIAIALAILVVIVEIFRGVSILSAVQYVLILTVAGVPVAMPTVLSVTMAVGARVLARQEAIVTRLASIEELAGVDVLCSDKTGTLTQNKLTLGDPFTVKGASAEDAILDGALASREEDQDPIDLAVLAGVKDKDKLKQYDVTDFVPFDPVHKRTEATVKGPDGKQFKVTKGAPQVILELATDRKKVEEDVNNTVNEFASRGYRSLGVARADKDEKWKFVSVLPLYDPPREDSKDTLDTARQMGINTKMITGDQVAIAKEIARQLGLGMNIVDASVFEGEGAKDKDALAAMIEQADGFAQVFPEHKFQIIDSLQKHNHIVGMTGDGVNDAPPLKKADAGIAVSGATDAARSAADIVLLRPGLSVIIDAIKQSRRIFERMNSYAIYRIAETIDVLVFIVLAIIVFGFYPLTAIMIVLLAILNDGAILSISYDNTVISNEPQAWDMRRVLGIATALGLFRVVESFALLYLGREVLEISRRELQTFLYLSLSVGGHLTVFAARTRGPFWSIKPARILLLAVVGTQFLATFISVYGWFLKPIGWEMAGLVWVYVFAGFLIQDRLKLEGYRWLDPEHSAISEGRRRKKKLQ